MSNVVEYNSERDVNESLFRYKVRLCLDKLNKVSDLDWSEIANLTDANCSSDHLRKMAYAYREMSENEELENELSEEDVRYKETTEILKDGLQKSDKLIKMSLEQSKDVNYLLEAHGFDKETWEIVNAKNNIWNVNSKKQGVQTLYSSKITVKPKTSGFDIDKFIEIVEKKVEPIIVDTPLDDGEYNKLLEIPIYDAHFGIAKLEDYKKHLSKMINKIKSRKWDTILFVVGQDLLHNDNFKGQTANGTMIDKVDMELAFNDALQFYITLFKEALQQSINVKAIYSKGNHDESLSYGFFRTIQATFPQVKFDSALNQRKAFVWEDVFIMITHGDKGATRLFENCITEFGHLVSKAKVKEIHSGHLHVEKVKNQFGLMHRTLSTAKPDDDWHQENGFVGGEKRFQIFEYSSDSLDAIYYI